MRYATVLLLVSFCSPVCAVAPPVLPLSEARIQKLIRQLGSEVYQHREQAAILLRQHQEAEPALRQALRSSDAEVARRARSILADLTQQRLAWALEHIRADAAAGRVDLLAERLVQWQGRKDDDTCWETVFDLGKRLAAVERARFKRIGFHREGYRNYFPSNFQEYMKWHRGRALPAGRPDVKVDKASGIYLARGRRVAIKDFSRSLIVASRLVQAEGAGRSFVLSGGDVEMIRGGGWLVVVCSGDYQNKQSGLTDSLVVARGSVRISSGLKDCVILAGGDVSFSEGIYMRNVTVRAAGRVTLPKKSNMDTSDLKGGVRDALALVPVKFFETSSVGVAVAPSRYGVRVTTATPGKPFARAGLRVDDLVTALDGGAVRSPEMFRRLLRKRLVAGGDLVLQVRRQGKTVPVRVPQLR